MTDIGREPRNQSGHSGHGDLQAIVMVKEHVKTPATSPPSSHLHRQDGWVSRVTVRADT